MNDSLDNLPTIDPGFEPSAAELKEGQFLGENQNYRLEKNLGVGGMGEVWLAVEIRADQEIRKVVVKTLRPDRRGNEGAQEKALEQFKLIQKLNHQNICPIYVIEKDPACGYLVVMGYAAGGSFADWFAGQPKPLAEVCRVLRPIADALDFAHSKGVIHRDVKPSNMMFTSDHTPWLIDFGIAANLRTATQATTGQYGKSGTDSYMAPEQKSGQLQTQQTDEYSLALVALEFLTGTTYLQAIQKLPSEIQPILNKALALDLSDRYATCREFIDVLSSPQKDGPAPKTAIGQIVEAERLAAEAKRRAEEEALQKKIQAIDDLVAEEYHSGRYAEAIDNLNELLKLRPNDSDFQWMLKSCQEKLAIQKKEEAERKAREEAERKAREEAERKAREEAERKAREEAERKAREEAERKAREEAESKAREEAGRKALEEENRRRAEPLIDRGYQIEGTILKKYKGKETCVEIPEGITEIGDGAFSGCTSLTSVVIPDSVEKIGRGAFEACTALKKWSISSVHSYFKTDGIGLLTKDGKKLIACLGSAKEYRIPKGVTQIEGEAFYGCSFLTSVVLPKGVREIGNYTFSGCRSLTSMVLPKGVTEIGYSAFSGCISLTSVVIPEGVTRIRGSAFFGCSSLTSVVIPEGVTKIVNYAFCGCSSLTSVVIPRSVKTIGVVAFENCPKLKIKAPIFSYAWWWARLYLTDK